MSMAMHCDQVQGKALWPCKYSKVLTVSYDYLDKVHPQYTDLQISVE